MRIPLLRRLPPALLAAALAAGAGSARADVHPNTASGFPANGEFNSGEIDSVNLFNGGLTLTVPIGGSYPVNADFSYSLKLIYNSNPWMFQTVTHLIPPDYHEVTRTAAFPNPCSNAGLGWRVSLGRMDPPCQVPDVNGQLPGPVYEDENGTDHVFYATLHAGDPEDAPLAGVNNILYTRDGTYLRLKVFPGNVRDVEFPNGMVKRFDASGRLTQIRDPFGNFLNVSYATANQWVLTDTQGRTHRVIFRTDLPSYPQTIDRIELANFTGLPAVYQFTYSNALIGRPCPHNDNTDAMSIGPNVIVPLLTGVILPDLSQWKTTSGDYINALAGTAGCTENGGNLTAWTMPTLGRFEWTYQTYAFPTGSSNRKHLQKNPGVATRAMRNPNGALLGVWTYTTPPIGTVLASKDLVNTVTDPLGNKKVSYFSTALDGSLTGWSKYEYSLPFTRNSTLNVAPGVDLNLSTQVLDAAGTPLRSEYVLYERDVAYGSSAPDLYNTNRRMLRARTVYHDDPGVTSGVIHQDFDGVGHYRLTQTEGSFPVGSNVQNRYEHTDPARGSYSINAAANTPNPGFTPVPSSAPWALGTMDFAWESEAGATAFRATCYAPGSTQLSRLRTYRLDGAAQGTKDLVTVYDRAANGNVIAEKRYGGDVQGGIPNATGDNCTMALPAVPEYQINHTYQGGVRATSQYAGTTHLVLDRIIDVNSGLVTYERDSSGIGAGYEYDAMGRVTWSKPDAGHDGWTQFLYNQANPTTLANAYVFRRHRDNGSKSASILTTSQEMVDPFGRVTLEQRRLPDGSLNKRETLYDNAGNRASVSSWVTSATTKKTVFLNYDAFGRPGIIRPADGAAHDITLTYQGVRRVDRTAKVGTSTAGTETPVTTTEIRDRLGRLAQLIEPSGNGGANVTTSYAYDMANRLISTSTTAVVPGWSNVTQTRTRTYDRAGLLTSEVVPEMGPSGNGTVSYPSYDSMRRLRQKLDGVNNLTYLYDAAGRLYRIRETNGAQRTLKTFSFANNNGTFTDPATGVSCTDYRKGKVTSQSRFNYVTVGGGPFTVEIRENRTYCGRDGRESRRTLENYVNGAATPSESFVLPNVTYDAFGEVTSQGYPQCTHAACAAPLPRTVTSSYTDGLLASVGIPGNAAYYASGLSYHPNLMVNQVVHANGLTDSYVNDANALPRLASFSVTAPGGAVRWSSGPFAYDGAGNVKSIGSDTFAYDKVGRIVASNQYLEPVGPVTLRSQSFTYDAFGNLLTVGGHGARNTPTTPTNNRLQGGGFDNAGNLTSWNGNLYDYGPFNQVWRYKTPSDEWIYLYDANDERVWSYKTNNTSLWTLRDFSGRVLREYANNGVWSLAADYVYRGGFLLAAETPAGIRHFHLDHLGSPRLVSDSLGVQKAFHVYFPYGDEATAFNQDTIRAKFAGQERDLGNLAGAGDDLDYLHARFYNPLTGRFLSVDPVSGGLGAPVRANRYAYAADNPLKYTDPEGLWPFFWGGMWGFSESITVTTSPWRGTTANPFTGVDGLNSLIAGRNAMNGGNDGFADRGVRWVRDYYQNRFEQMVAEDNLVAAFIDYVGLELVIPQDGTDLGVQAAMMFIPEIKLAKNLTPSFKYACKKLGVNRELASKALHAVKEAAGRGGADNVLFDKVTGDIISPQTLEVLGNLWDFH